LKKFPFLPIAFLLSFFGGNPVFAQKNDNGKMVIRCATMLRIEQLNLENTRTKASTEGRSKSVLLGSPTSSNYRLMGIVTVPVVVHIVLPNPFLVTDADIQSQIDRLNLDFSGLNPDSTNAEQFYGVRGHSQIQFCLAKRTPSGQLTLGIERRASSTGSLPLQATDPIKFTDQGGLDSWDPNSYLNLWVGTDASGNDVLGYAQFPGTGDARQDGVFINYKSWGGNTCYTISQYNKGRTATHEIGHYFGLFHVWGDDDGCNGDDFRDLADVNSSFRLPAGLYNPEGQGNTSSDVGDTPNQAGATNNCTSGIVTDDCAKNAPGKCIKTRWIIHRMPA
jgi:hypothetical protein